MGKKGKQVSRKRKASMPEEDEKQNEMILEEILNISGKHVEKVDGSPPARLKKSTNKIKEELSTQEEKISTQKRCAPLLLTCPTKLDQSTDEQKEARDENIKISTSEGGLLVPDGWRRKAVVRKSGKTAGQIDIYYYSPDGTKLRSRPDVASYLAKHKSNLKVEEFDFSKTRKVTETSVKKKDSTENSTIPRKKRKSVQDEKSEDGLNLKDSSKAVSTEKTKPSEKCSSNMTPVDAKEKNDFDGKSNRILIKILESKPKKTRK